MKSTSLFDARGRILTRLFGAVLLALPLTVRVLPAQDAKPDAGRQYSNSGAAFLPLQRGSAWTWRVERSDGDEKKQWLEHSVVWGDVPHPEGGVCAQVITRIELHDYIAAEYRRADATGIHHFGNIYTGGNRGVGAGPGTRVLPAPVGAETRWQWESRTALQTRAGHEPDPDELKELHSAEILGVDEPMTVAAGAFRCVHLRHRAEYTHWKRVITRDVWFGRGAGVVKETQSWDGGSQTKELQQFHAGTPPGVAERAEVVKNWLGKARDAEIEWLPPGEEAFYLRGRFAMARDRGLQQQWLLHVDEVCTEIRPNDKEFWAAQWLLACALPPELGVVPEKPGQHIETDMVLTCLAHTVARVEALRRGMTEIKQQGSRSETTFGLGREIGAPLRQNAGVKCRAAVSAKTGDQVHRLEGILESANGVITKVDVTVDAPASKDREGPLRELPPLPRRR